MTHTARDPTSDADSPEVTQLDMSGEGTMENMEMTNTAGDTSGAGSLVVMELDTPVEGETQDMGTAANDENQRGTCSPKFMKLADGNLLSWLCQNKLRALVVAVLAVVVLATIVFTTAATMRLNNASKEDLLHGYARLPAHEVYRPKPSFVLDNTDLLQCTKKALTNNNTGAAAFQFCAAEGMELGRCELFIDNTPKLRTRLADNCDVYFRGDPADLGIAHGGAAKTGLAGGLSWILVSVVLRELTHLLMDC